MLILTPLMTWIPHSQLLKFIVARGLQHGGCHGFHDSP